MPDIGTLDYCVVEGDPLCLPDQFFVDLVSLSVFFPSLSPPDAQKTHTLGFLVFETVYNRVQEGSVV